MSHEDLDHGSAAYLCLTGVYHATPLGQSAAQPQRLADLRRDPPPPAARRAGSSTTRSTSTARRSCRTKPGPGQDGGFLGRGFEPLVVGDPSGGRRRHSRPGPAGRLAAGAPERTAVAQAIARPATPQRLEANQRALDMNRLYAPGLRRCSPRRRPATRSTSRRSRQRSATATAGIAPARRCSSPGGWSKRACRISTSSGTTPTAARTTSPTTPTSTAGTRTTTFSTRCRTACCRDSTRASRRLIEDLDQRGPAGPDARRLHGRIRPRAAGRPGAKIRRRDARPQALGHASIRSSLAGAGVQRGAVVGASDRLGAEPITERYGPWDVAATMFHALGIDPHGHYTDTQDRPYAIATGKPIEAALRVGWDQRAKRAQAHHGQPRNGGPAAAAALSHPTA